MSYPLGKEHPLGEEYEQNEQRIVSQIETVARRINRRKNDAVFSSVFFYGRQHKFNEYIQFLMNILSVPTQNIINITVASNTQKADPELALLEKKDAIAALAGDMVIVVATGFLELFAKTTHSYDIGHIGHDWNQAILENRETQLVQAFKKLGKHIVVVTIVPRYNGVPHEQYEAAKRSFSRFQMTMGIVEI